MCRVCQNDHRNSIRRRVKLEAIAYKGGRCTQCGFCESADALCFHHIDPSRKEFQISNKGGTSLESIKAELDICALLCLNCHAMEHARIRADSRELYGTPNWDE